VVRRFLVLFVVLFFVVVGNAWGESRYAVTDLGTTYDVAGINCGKQVIGDELNTNNKIYIQAYLWQGSGERQYLGTLGGNRSFAYGINAAGTVVGAADYESGGCCHAFVWKASSGMRDLGTFGGPNSQAFALNNSGQVVGDAQISTNYWHAFLYNGNGSLIDLFPGSTSTSRATGINDSGYVVGYALSGSKAFIYTGGSDLYYIGNQMWPNAINNDNIIVGIYQPTAGVRHAFLYHYISGTSGVTTDLGTLGGQSSQAYAINSSGLVVGYATTSDGKTHAFLYDGSGPIQDLNNLIDPSSGWTLNMAKGINDNGQIVGIGQVGGYNHAFLLTPVPEPSTILLLIVAAISLLAYRG
jgi:probable HAF family extracellular repeat protein